MATQSLHSRDALQSYLTDVRRARRLDPGEQLALAVQYAETGDEAAKQALVTGNLRLVVKAAFRVGGRSGSVLDLIQEGNVGLMRAVEKFDPSRGVPFAGYATYWIRATLYRYLMNHQRLAKLGTTRNGRKLFFQLEKERRRLRSADHEPTIGELSKALEVPEREIISFEQLLHSPVSLDQPGQDGRSWSETLSDIEAVDPENQAATIQLHDQLRRELGRFAETLQTKRERAIWDERLLADEPMTLAALGKQFGVSKERIRQIETRLKKRLRGWLVEHMGDVLRLALAA